MASSKPTTYLNGHEYDLGNGTTGVWSNAEKRFMSAEEFVANKSKAQPQFDDMVATMQRIAKAKEYSKKWGATGFLGNLTRDDGEGAYRGIGGTPGYNLNEMVLPLKSNAFLKAAMDTRSPITGGAAVPNPSNKEGARLESRDASLNIGQSGERVREELDQYRSAMTRRYKGISPENPYILGEDDPQAIPQGAYFRAPNGKLYRNQKGAPAAGQTAADRGMQVDLGNGVVATVRAR